MSFFSRLTRRLFSPRSHTTARKQPTARFRPRLESLEDRCVPSAGAPDPTFGTTGVVTTELGGTDDRAFAVTQQPDGKYVVAGISTASGSGQFAVTRYTADGTLDSAFGTGGIVQTKVGKLSSYAQAVAIQPDGKIVVAGYADQGYNPSKGWTYGFVVVRYNADGSLDTTFGGKSSKGIVVTQLAGPGQHEFGSAIALQPDGKILVAGELTQPGSGDDFVLLRYSANGTLDTSFGGTGYVTADFDGAEGANNVFVLTDASGKLAHILVVGQSSAYINGVWQERFGLVEYNPNGTLNTSFGTGGTATISVGTSYPFLDLGYGALQGNQIILAGSLYYGNNSPGTFAPVLARVTADGQLDTSFGENGLVFTDPSVSVRISSLAVQGDGKILVTGEQIDLPPYGPGHMELIRYDANGALDSTFGTGGLVATPIGPTSWGEAVMVQSDGRIVTAGFSRDATGNYDFALARYLPSEPQPGSFTAAASGSTATLTVSGITDGNPGATVTQVAFYVDSNRDGKLDPAVDLLLGYGIPNAEGTWTYTFSLAGWESGLYTLFVQAMDDYGVLGDPLSTILQIVI